MRVAHRFGRFQLEGEGDDNFLLTNGVGGFVSLSQSNISKFQGVTFSEFFDAYKFIENIAVEGNIIKLINKFYEIERVRDNGINETIFMPKGRNSFLYKLNETKEIIIDLDPRRYFDFREWGRDFEIYGEDNRLIVKYAKRTDKREDKSHGKKEYEIYMAVIPDSLDYEKIERWEKREYSYDKERKGAFERYVFRAFKIKAKRLIFGFGTTKEKAIEEASFTKENLDELVNERIAQIKRFGTKKLISREIRMANLCCQNALNELVTRIGSTDGIFAGYYWFSEFWARDELVSLLVFLKRKNFDFVKNVLFRYLNLIDNKGRVPNRIPPTETGSADAVGWLFKGVSDFIEMLIRQGELQSYINYREALFIKHSLEKSIHNLLEHHSKNDFITNDKKETWMDSIERDGIRIEMQAMVLNMYKLLRRLSRMLKDKSSEIFAKEKERTLLKNVRKYFWNGHYLNDGIDDKTIRPNVFIAYYVYPELLKRKEWIVCFDNILPRLFVDFGLASVDTHSLLFNPLHTGEDDKSYHNGDSWYWLNNIAAICLWRLGKFRYAKYIHKILHGSTRDILWFRIPGHASEISSAREQKSFGCLSQAWSAATYIELVEELF